ncbi:MAG: glycosyltransferase involved in cell wall biosynthesis, partial [Cognaticolwellia sp.]
MISVIIPCYNVEVYIERCIDSILSQTIVDELQVICIDDGSTDNTFNLLEKYRNKFHNIILIKQSNQGQSAARNKGLELATGEYVGFIDSDDWINSVYYEELLTAMNKNKSDIVFCCMETVHESGAVDPTNARDYAIDEFTCISLSSIERENVIKKFLMDRISVSPCNKLIKRDLVIDNNIKFSEGLYNEDMEFTFDLLMVSRKISKINDSIYSYWQREFSTTKASNYRALDMLFIVDRIKDKIYKANLQDKFLYEMVHFEL